jgi:hypothetical protein
VNQALDSRSVSRVAAGTNPTSAFQKFIAVDAIDGRNAEVEEIRPDPA